MIEYRSGTVLIYTINRVEPWWAEVGRNMGYARSVTVSDIRGDGDMDVVDDFYVAYAKHFAASALSSPLLDVAQIDDIIARCRLLRWLPKRQAAAMALAMADAFTVVLDSVQPSLITCFPMDRYVSDVLERIGKARGIPFYEVTAGAVPGTSMILYRGQLIKSRDEPDPALIEATVREIASPLFTPAYVQGAKRFTKVKWIKIFAYFRLRGWVFKAISMLKRDPLSLHYLDAQSSLGHKPHLRDIKIVDLVEDDWREKLARFAQDRRLFLGLQLFPEASIDYWVPDLGIVDYENMLVDVVAAFTAAGFAVLVKDHPLQFGFRQIALLERLKAFATVIIVPYEVSGNEALDQCGVNFTCTGTLGMQAALTGKISVVTPSYYSNDEDFITFTSRADVAGLPARVIAAKPPASLADRQYRIVKNLLRGSFASDFFSFKGFDAALPNKNVAEFGYSCGIFIQKILLK